MWRDKRTGIWQTKLRGQQNHWRQTKKLLPKTGRNMEVNMAMRIFGLRNDQKLSFMILQRFMSKHEDYRNDQKFEAKKENASKYLEKHIYPDFEYSNYEFYQQSVQNG